MRWTLPIAALVASATFGTAPASADCQLQWQPDPFGGTGGSLVYVCGNPEAPTGNSGGKHKKKPSYAAITVSLRSLNDGDKTFGGAYAAGYNRKSKAVRKAKAACRGEFTGRCRPVATARNGWAALVATMDAQQRIRVFGGKGKKAQSALRAAERKAHRAFGGNPPNLARVRAVRSKSARR